MSGALPSGCLLDRRVRTDHDDGDDEDLTAQQPFLILSCVDKKASGFFYEAYADEVVQSMDIGVHLADAPPDLSCLGLRGGSPFTDIEAVDKDVMVLTSTFPGDFGLMVYLIYDAIDESLRMIPLLEDPSSRLTLTTRILIARPRPRHGSDESSYALVLTGKRDVASGRERDSLFLWRPSSSSPPWSEIKKASFPDQSLVDERVYQADMVFSCNGHGYWADLLCGVMHCSCDALFSHGDDDDPVVEFGFIRLPFEPAGHHRSSCRVAQPDAYRTMGVVQDSVRFVSIDGFLEHVDLKDRTVTVWRLLDDMTWGVEHELSLETLWGLEGFDDLPKDMTPMFPRLSTEDKDVVYFALGEYRENRRKGKFIPTDAHYLLRVDMRNKIIRASIRLEDWFGSPDIPDLVSCDFSRYLHPVDPFAAYHEAQVETL